MEELNFLRLGIGHLIIVVNVLGMRVEIIILSIQLPEQQKVQDVMPLTTYMFGL